MAKETRALRKPVPLSVPELKVSSLRKRSVNHKIMAFLGGRLRKKNFLNAKTDQHQFSPNFEYPYIFKRRGQEIQ